MDLPLPIFPNKLNPNPLLSTVDSLGLHGFMDSPDSSSGGFSESFGGMLAQPSSANSSIFAPTGTVTSQSPLHGSWQQTTPLSTIQPIQSHHGQVSLGQLLVMYPAVQALHNNLSDANQKILLALETQSALVKDNMRLVNELREVTARSHLDS